MAKEKNMNQKLVQDIYDAVCNNVKHVIDHLDRGKENEKDHSNIEMFQRAICKELNKTSNCVYDSEQECKNCKNSWECEYSASGRYKDSIDIYGDLKDENGKRRPCIIEIDAVRHDQIAAKFVSRVALCGLEGPIDYVAILYDSSQDSGRQSAEKFIQYMYSILKKINDDSALIGIFVHVDKDNHVTNVEIWDCLQQEYRIKEIIEDNKETNDDNNSDKGTYDSMVKCAIGAVEYYITKHPKVTFNKLQDIFKKKTSYYVFDKEIPGLRTKKIEKGKNSYGHDVFVDSQFRSTGNQTNWLKFVKICKNNKITIEEKYKQPDFVKNPI